MFVYIDDTVWYNDLHKYIDVPWLVDPQLKETIARLRKSNIRVIGLTARREANTEKTLEELSMLGISLDDVIHAPSVNKCPTKGVHLYNYLKEQEVKPKRIFVFDDLMKHYKEVHNIK